MRKTLQCVGYAILGAVATAVSIVVGAVLDWYLG